MNFSNVVVATQVNGLPALENVGEETLEGAEAELSWRFASDLRAQVTYAYHDAKFGDYLADFGGTLQQLDGNRIEMSAHNLASAGLVYLPAKGFNANAIVNYVGSRFLDKRIRRRRSRTRPGRPELATISAMPKCGSTG